MSSYELSVQLGNEYRKTVEQIYRQSGSLFQKVKNERKVKDMIDRRTERHKERQLDRQTERKTDRKTVRQTERTTDRKTVRQTDSKKDI